MAKHMLTLKDSTVHEIVDFLDQAALHGAKIKTQIGPAVDPDGTRAVDPKTHNVAYEARQLKRLFLKLIE
jgi:tetratricopeptide repeat protein 30